MIRAMRSRTVEFKCEAIASVEEKDRLLRGTLPIVRPHESCYAGSNHMLGTAISTALAPRTDRDAYVVWMGVIWAAILGGFALDFSRYMSEIPPPPIILHVHGAIYAIWLVLVSAQIFLVQTGHIRLHMRLGWATAIVSAAMVPLGLVAAMVDQARQAGHPDYAPQFLALEFEEMLAFSTFIIAGLLSRRNLAEHKRWMILSAIAISDAGFGRIWQMGIKHTLPGAFGWWLQYFWGITLLLIAMLVWDWFRHKRIMGPVVWGAAVLWGGQIATTVLNFTPAWKSLMVELVRAWGSSG
jgi:hypothetical protein